LAEGTQKTRSGWRDDPLSIALFGAFAILVAMFAIDESRKSAILDGAQSVASLGAPLGDGCSLSAAGPGGRTLLVRCQERAASAVRERASSVWGDGLPSGDDAAAFRDASGTLVCSGAPKTWSAQERCAEPVKPLTRAQLQQAQRRRNRAEE